MFEDNSKFIGKITSRTFSLKTVYKLNIVFKSRAVGNNVFCRGKEKNTKIAKV